MSEKKSILKVADESDSLSAESISILFAQSENQDNNLGCGGINGRLFFLLLLVYHVAITFQGFDLLDEGFHAIFYQRIFDDPASVQYNFFYWFSGIVGGLVLKIMPGLGLWGLRLTGALVSCSTILITYHLLKKIIPRGSLQAGIVILSLYINTEPKDIHYNTLSAFLFFLAAFLLFNGLKNQNRFLILLCGAVLGLNTFTRLPNVIGAVMALAIIFDGYLKKRKFPEIAISFLNFGIGFLVSVLVVLGIMYTMGHFDNFIDSIKFLFSLTTTTSNKDELAGSYGMSRLFYVLAKQHSISISLVFSFTGIVILYKSILDFANKLAKNYFSVDILFLTLISSVAILLILTDRITTQQLTFVFTGFSVFTSLIYIFGNFAYEKRLISLLGLLIMIVHPFGSAPGILSVMLYSMWINFPMGVALVANMAAKNIEINVLAGMNKWYLYMPENRFLKRTLQWFFVVILVICIRHIFAFPYFYDKHDRIDMVHGINSPQTKYIYTSSQRAKVLNELLSASSRYVKKGDPVFAYDAMPMYFFMTETRPFLPNSTPLFYTSTRFTADLSESVRKTGLPVVVKQNIWTIHEGSGWPENIVKVSAQQAALNKNRDLTFNKFLKDYGYSEVWTNGIFSIYVPPSLRH